MALKSESLQILRVVTLGTCTLLRIAEPESVVNLCLFFMGSKHNGNTTERHTQNLSDKNKEIVLFGNA